jgi:hypothetical protein
VNAGAWMDEKFTEFETNKLLSVREESAFISKDYSCEETID